MIIAATHFDWIIFSIIIFSHCKNKIADSEVKLDSVLQRNEIFTKECEDFINKFINNQNQVDKQTIRNYWVEHSNQVLQNFIWYYPIN